MKKLILAALVAATMPCALGQLVNVAPYNNSVVNARGVPVGGASIKVCANVTGCTPATIYSDQGITAIGTSIVTADATGNFSFWAACGKYKLLISGGGFSATWSNVSVIGSDCFGMVVAKADAVTQGANVSSSTLYAVPANAGGSYRALCYVAVTQAATSSSTLPSCQISYTDLDSSAAISGVTLTSTQTANTVGTNSVFAGGGTQTFYAPVVQIKAGTNVTWLTTGYATSGATPMQYAVHIKLQYLGQ